MTLGNLDRRPERSEVEARERDTAKTIFGRYVFRKTQIGEADKIPRENMSFLVVDMLRVLTGDDFALAMFRVEDVKFIRALPSYLAVVFPRDIGIRENDSAVLARFGKAGVSAGPHEMRSAVFVRNVFKQVEKMAGKNAPLKGVDEEVTSVKAQVSETMSSQP